MFQPQQHLININRTDYDEVRCFYLLVYLFVFDLHRMENNYYIYKKLYGNNRIKYTYKKDVNIV